MPVVEADDAGAEEQQNGDGEHEKENVQEEETRGRSGSPSSVRKRANSQPLITDASSAAAWSGDEERSPS
jgi:hypothetical protein